MCKRVMQLVSSMCIICTYMSQNIGCLLSLELKNLKSVYGSFLSHLDVVNVTLNCLFTPGLALLPFFVCTCVPPRGSGDPRV